MVRAVAGHFARRWRTSSHQTHLPAQHIPELWQFVNIASAQDPSKRCHSRIVTDLENVAGHFVMLDQLRQLFLGRDVHCAELVEREESPIAADARLFEKHGPFSLAANPRPIPEVRKGANYQA